MVPAQAGKVTVGLASHWPCVADNSGTTGYLVLISLRKGDEHPAYAPVEYGRLYSVYRAKKHADLSISRSEC